MKRHAPEETYAELPLLSAIDEAEKRAARDRAELGMLRSTQHAERKVPGWYAQALEAVRKYAVEHPEPFLCEQVRASMPFVNVDGRAFGSVMQHAKRNGWIEKVGAAAAVSSNLSLKVQWRSRIASTSKRES